MAWRGPGLRTRAPLGSVAIADIYRHTQRVLPSVPHMKAVTGDLPAKQDGWAFELKWDGMLH